MHYCHIADSGNNKNHGAYKTKYLSGTRIADQESKKTNSNEHTGGEDSNAQFAHRFPKLYPAVKYLYGVIDNESETDHQRNRSSNIHIYPKYHKDKYHKTKRYGIDYYTHKGFLQTGSQNKNNKHN